MLRIVRIAFVLAFIMVVSGSFRGVSAADNKLDSFAKCLAEKNVKMYGLFWCQHCADQKELFGSSFQYVNYVECAVPGSRTPTEECKAAGIKHTPTWTFSNGTRLEGLVPLDQLAKQSGCKLP
ncbi:MAG TPA: hypothetical protein VN577_20325 [Terriglobales bacterium]|nr:hypothetical protein [Terriglobales bacterium]